MSNIAVISLAGAQHLVQAGDKLEVNRLEYDLDKDTSADVLLSTKGGDLLLNEGEVKFKVLEHKLGEKLHVVKFRAKSRYRRKVGHRQKLTVIEVLSINGEKKESKSKDSAKASTKVEEKPAKKAVTKTAPKTKATVKKGAKK